ncbi:hypothetical protein PInf_030121 [Phytophthora infestans]|nr:hypothetical protein PInf_030121 [Phytophthora infestans]
MSVPTAPCDDDTLLSDILAFVDTFPADSEQLLNDNTDTIDSSAMHEDDGNTAAITAQSREERRRMANRLKDRNKYLRKKERIPKLHAEIEQLTKILADYERGRILQSQQTETSLVGKNEKEKQLIQLSNERNDLLIENAQLRKQFRRASALATNLQQMLNSEHKLSLGVITPSYGVLKSMNRAREICGKSARFVSNQTWEVFLDPFCTEKLFAPIMNVRCRLVQRVDGDNVLFCYDHAASCVLSEKTDIPSVSTMALVTRVSTGASHLIITRGLRHGSVEVQDLLRSTTTDRRREIWLETLTWIQFEQLGQDCKVTIGGITPALRQSSYFWMIECVQLALRWEMAVLGPRFRAT